MKNLLYLHLDALPQTFLWLMRSEMPAIWRLVNESMQFTKCYSSATSTTFVLNSVLHGSSSRFDGFPKYELYRRNYLTPHRGLFEVLQEDYGYQCEFVSCSSGILTSPQWKYFYSNCIADYENIISFDVNTPHWDELESTAKRLKPPFMLYVHDLADILHSPLLVHTEGKTDESFVVTQLLREVQRRFDRVVASVRSGLEESGFWENTVVVAFADHGCSLKTILCPNPSRGTGIDAFLSWVPLFIANSALGKGIRNDLVSLDDIPFTALSLMFPEDKHAKIDALPFSGIDITQKKREFAFTQNKHTMQNDCARLGDTSMSYAVTDGTYRLIVASMRTGQGGMELYFDEFDYGNQSDLLTLFILDKYGEVVDLNFSIMTTVSRWTVYMQSYWNPVSLILIIQRYILLREKLMEYVREKEQHARQNPEVCLEYAFTQKSFTIAKNAAEKPLSTLQYKGIPWLKNQNQPIMLFGASIFGQQIKTMLEYFHIKVTGFIDNNPAKQYTVLDGIPVHPLETVVSQAPHCLILGTFMTAGSNDSVARQCLQAGMSYYSLIKDICGGNLFIP